MRENTSKPSKVVLPKCCTLLQSHSITNQYSKQQDSYIFDATCKQKGYPDSPYDLCMTFVIERIMKDIPPNATCLIIIEARGSKEDKEVLDHIKKLIDFGNNYNSKSVFKKIKGVYFNPKWCQLADDQMSYWALELADLCAYPFYKYFTYGHKDKSFDTLEPKISCYPNYFGKGIKSFP